MSFIVKHSFVGSFNIKCILYVYLEVIKDPKKI